MYKKKNIQPQEETELKNVRNKVLKGKQKGKKKTIEKDWVVSGLPYDPRIALIDIALPSSIYSSVIVVPMSHGQELWTMIIPQFICYIVCITLQISFLVYLRLIVLDNTTMCTTGGHYLRIICLLVFVAAGVLDVQETIGIHLWVNQLSTFRKSKEQPIIDEVYKSADKGGIMGRTDMPHQDYSQIGADDGEDKMTKMAVGITMGYRLLTYIFVILPKFFIAVLMLYYGCGHVLGSADAETMILNTLAAMFVFEVDDIIYNLMVSPLHQFWVEKTFSLTKSAKAVSSFQLYSFWVILIVYLLVCSLDYIFWCDVPGYWDTIFTGVASDTTLTNTTLTNTTILTNLTSNSA